MFEIINKAYIINAFSKKALQRYTKFTNSQNI